MTRHDTKPDDREERLDRVIAEFLEGSGTDSVADRRRWLTRYPEFFDELSDFFAGRDEVEKLAAPLRDLARTADVDPDPDWLGPSEVPDHIGRIGPYEILDRVGRGGMGVVYKGHDAALNRYVAVKALAPQWSSDPAARRRFTREAQAAAAVSHPHVITIHAVGEWRGRPFLVMEFVTGVSLQQRIDECGSLELKELLRIGMQVASGLAAAHAQGLIHRDIKPSNIMLENELARVKITDFGLARAVDDTRLTQYGTLAGTPAYMAPEQARGEPMDRRSDLFSLGSALYAMATGCVAFPGESSVEVIRRVSDGDPTPVRTLNPEIPEWLAEIVGRLHAKDPADRFQSAGEVADLLERHLARLQDPSLPAVEHPWVRRPSRVVAAGNALARRRGVRRLALMALLLAVAGGSAAWTRWLLQDQAPEPEPVAAQPPATPAPPDPEKLVAVYRQDFRDSRYDNRWLRLEPDGPAGNLVRPEARGLRIAIPAKTNTAGIGTFTRFGVHGDFEITASFEILKVDKPKDGGSVGPELYLRTIDGWGDYVAMARFIRAPEAEPHILVARGEKVEGQIRYHTSEHKNAITAGRFRITRSGPMVQYLLAPADSDDFRELATDDFGIKDLNMVRLMAKINGAGVPLDLLWKDLTIRAESLPGWTDPAAPPPRASMWLVLLAGLVFVAVLALALWWHGARRAPKDRALRAGIDDLPVRNRSRSRA
jgi:serine/threonine protein kinase